jgi:hypothetical protein
VIQIFRTLSVLCLICNGVIAAEILPVSGGGQTPVSAGNKKDVAAINQGSPAAAQRSAVVDTHPSEMESYSNWKYSYSVDFPKLLLVPEGESIW